MINHDLKTIFIHIPKCAGTSIEAVLGHHDAYEGYGRQDHRTIRKVRPKSNPVAAVLHRRMCDLRYFSRWGAVKLGKPYKNPRNMVTVTQAQFDSYFKFAFVRNPWDRTHSIFRKLMAGEWKTGEYGIDGPMEFDVFLDRFVGGWMLRPQTYYICDADGAVLVDFIGKFENLQADFGYVCDQLGIDHVTLPQLIKGPGGDYREAYSDHGRDLIAQAYAEEIRLLDYTLE